MIVLQQLLNNMISSVNTWPFPFCAKLSEQDFRLVSKLVTLVCEGTGEINSYSYIQSSWEIEPQPAVKINILNYLTVSNLSFFKLQKYIFFVRSPTYKDHLNILVQKKNNNNTTNPV